MRTLVSGRAFLGLIRHVIDVDGQEQLDRIVESAGSDTQAIFERRISKLGWYPYVGFTRFLAAAEQELTRPGKSVCHELGSVAGKRDLGTVLKIYLAIASPERLIRASKLVWPSYYRNAGRMEAVEWQPESTVLRIYDFPEMTRLHCQLMEGWMIATMESLGLEVLPGARQTAFMGDGARYHEFCCSWRLQRTK
ncbi:MAG: hypothetical protein R3B13_15235 [Polyangiaceae bacterium]